MVLKEVGMSDNPNSPARHASAKPKKKASKTLLLIAGIVVGGLAILALVQLLYIISSSGSLLPKQLTQ